MSCVALRVASAGTAATSNAFSRSSACSTSTSMPAAVQRMSSPSCKCAPPVCSDGTAGTVGGGRRRGGQLARHPVHTHHPATHPPGALLTAITRPASPLPSAAQDRARASQICAAPPIAPQSWASRGIWGECWDVSASLLQGARAVGPCPAVVTLTLSRRPSSICLPIEGAAARDANCTPARPSGPTASEIARKLETE